jgi:hypothetical protein
MNGWSVEELVDKLAKDNPKRKRVVQMQVGRILATDEELQAYLAAAGQGVIIGNIIPLSEALVRRGVKGNIPAIKLAMEASGFYSPKSKVEHSGEISIAVQQVPRPPVVQDDIPDATVVEDDE